MIDCANKAIRKIDLLSDLPPLLFRLIVAYGFYVPAMTKLKNIPALIEWLTKMGIPFPEMNAYLSLCTEVAGVLCMILGLCTRLMSIPMMLVMFVAIYSVHWKNGFSVAHNGFQIPLYFLIMLFSIFVTGPGRFSVDTYIRRWFRTKI